MQMSCAVVNNATSGRGTVLSVARLEMVKYRIKCSKLGMHRYHFFTNRYEYEYFYLCTCRYRVPILLSFGLHESAINLEADFILSSADYVKPIVQN